jgi:hypothetical protein
VLLGNGDGTFGPNIDFATGNYSEAIATGDLNGDGDPDMVVTNPAVSSVSVLLNNSRLLGVDTTLPSTLSLSVAPNPSWHPMLSFDVPQKADVRLGIYDLNGRRVADLRHEVMAPGRYSQPWSGSTDGGQTVRPGIYFARLTVGNQTRSATIAYLH